MLIDRSRVLSEAEWQEAMEQALRRKGLGVLEFSRLVKPFGLGGKR